MNILYIVPYTPNHIRTRPYKFIRHLLQQGQRVTLACPWESNEDKEVLEDWQRAGATVIQAKITKLRSLVNVMQGLPGRQPMQAVYSRHPGLSRMIRCAVQNDDYDVIQVEHLRGANYALELLRDGQTIPIVWDSVDCISLLFERASQHSRGFFGRRVTRWELPRTRWYEGWLVSRFPHILVTSQQDQAALYELGLQHMKGDKANRMNIQVLPNGVNLEQFSVGEKPRKNNRIIFSGKMSYHANASAALYLVKEIMPAVWQERPDVEVWLVGKDPGPALCRLSEENPLIHVTGTVPDIAMHLQQATIAVAPMVYGVGIQNKVLEAMACATPVVASPQAVSALENAGQAHILTAANPGEFSAAILSLLTAPGLRKSLGEASRAYVETYHSWNRLTQRLVQVYESAKNHLAVNEIS